MTAPALRVVLIGFGPVGVRFAEELLPDIASGRVHLTVVGAERVEPYNRVLLAEYASGELEMSDLVIADTGELRAAGAEVLAGVRVSAIDRAAREVVLTDDTRVAYDRVVLATGARAVVPRLDGLEHLGADATGLDTDLTRGVVVLRSPEDAERVRRVVATGGRVVILGAGVLGIELALLLARAGAMPHVAHFGPMPMPRHLDRGSASVLAAALETAGVRVWPHTRAEAIIARPDADGVRRFQALVSSDGKRIEGDLLVLSCGVRARTELAEAAGLRTGRGVLVDDRLRSWTDPDIAAIGDCAHIADTVHTHSHDVPGGPSGLIGPGWRQAEFLARSLREEWEGAISTSFSEEVPGVVALKAEQVDLISAGDVSADPFAPVVAGETPLGVSMWADPEHGTYVKMVSRDGALTGFVSVGMPRTGAELSVLYGRRGELPADRSLLLRLDAEEDQGPRPTGREATICVCNAVTAGAIEDAVAEGCDTVAEVGRCTRAGTGCGGCRSRIAELIDARLGATA
ncbi:FAD-dependent oxidoreductase [Microbacterium stercoris]|uniref:NAD(P)/FAD-dependent oxidoreductase n=1 Tax=Microbacterium stercoris TaxID=2820289 RepID=A0A939QRW1_9MICO|nr:FAD-dependent oxidoreductase [Microbacterium stercoris]MBO3663968.1 NAD(P)/FAD-dependent oxidoreductase [Microbacterium stercoris]